MNNIDLKLTLKSHSRCINDIYYIFFIKINNLGNINIQEIKQYYNINNGYINSSNNKELLIMNSNNPLSESMMLFLYKTFKNFEYADNLHNFILKILPILLS
jgi:hypothetical protein